MSDVARRYARGAAEAAVEAAKSKPEQALEKLANAILDFSNAYHESSDLRELIQNPGFATERAGVLEKLGQKLGMDKIALRLVAMLGENERLDTLSDVARELQAIADERSKRQRAHVVSAIPLTAAQEKRIAKALESRLGTPIILDSETDPSVLGGFVCHVGAYTIDNSVRRQIQLVGERLSKTPSP